MGRSDSLGKTPTTEEEKSFKLKLDDDEGTPKFGDREKHVSSFPDMTASIPQEPPKRKVITQKPVSNSVGPDELGFETQ